MAEEKKPNRMKLTILEVKPRQVTNAEKGTTKLTFKANNGDGEHWFYTFQKSLFEIIEGGKDKTFEADVITTESEQWGTQRDVKLLYIDGQPVGSKGRGGSWGGKSPQEVASIESQVAAKLIVELRIAGVIDDKNTLYKKTLDWCSEKLKATPQNPKPANPEQAKEDIKDLWPEPPIEPSPEPVEIGEQKPEPTIKTIQALLNWVASHGSKKYDRSWVLKTFSFDETKMHDNPYECYLEIKQMMNW